MNSLRLATNTTIWSVALVLQCALVYVILRRGVARRFPLFGLLLIFYPVRAALLFGLTGHIESGAANTLNGVLSFIDIALQLMVAVELVVHLVRGMGGWTRFRAVLCVLLLGAASIVAWLTPALVPKRLSVDPLQVFAWFVLLVLFGAVEKNSRYSDLIHISAGMGVFSLLHFTALVGRTVAFLHRNGGAYVAWSYVPAIGYMVIVVFWIVTLRKEPKRIRVASKIAV
jgi:hypothetical protein